MFTSLLSEGLDLPRSGLPVTLADAESHLTVEAAVTPSPREELRVDMLVAEEAKVAQGQPLMRLRAAPKLPLLRRWRGGWHGSILCRGTSCHRSCFFTRRTGTATPTK